MPELSPESEGPNASLQTGQASQMHGLAKEIAGAGQPPPGGGSPGTGPPPGGAPPPPPPPSQPSPAQAPAAPNTQAAAIVDQRSNIDNVFSPPRQPSMAFRDRLRQWDSHPQASVITRAVAAQIRNQKGPLDK